ncbi:sensor histidine kinase [Microcella sp.]|uniref:sensor histidine kinase n=1 Tax=Microcella sp. TaxID=1913979 RepID=UPI002569BE28|nr:histidine kinase [Microcella sp.]MBX9471003.1 sensor histidine kinase [Microcella sp.]
MFDRILDKLTPHLPRLRTAGELGLGFTFSVVAAYYASSYNSSIPMGVLMLPLGVGIALHRLLPLWALLVSTPPIFLVVLTGWSGGTPNGALWFPIYIAIFGAVAYGSNQTRWVGRSFSLALTVGYLAGGLSSAGYGLGPFGLLVLFLPALAWFVGEMVRVRRSRNALRAQVSTVSTQRDAALTRADLEAERTRVARDVHDIVAHSLTVVIAQADGARYATAGDAPAAADAFETIAQTARGALADVRVLLTELRHTQEAGPQPGLDDLDALLDSMRDSGLTLEVREFGDRGRLTESRELALYRIVQESLTNALRHGDGAATLELEWGEQAVDLVVTNASPGETREFKEGGHGIDGMRERASLAGGELSVHDGPMFRVRARLPLEVRADGGDANLSQSEPADDVEHVEPVGASA